MSELVRIKKLKTGENMMVTPAYASRTKMLKNSGWVVEDLPETKMDKAVAILKEHPLPDLLKVDEKEETVEDNENYLIESSIDFEKEEPKVEEQKRRGRQPGSTNKTK